MNLTHTRGDVYRAMLEGIALGTGHVIETYREVGQAPDRLYAVGGGTNNRVWSQATSDILGQVQVLRKRSIGASYGDAFLTAVALGDASLEDIDRWNPVAGEIVPDAGNAAVYEKHLTVFKALYGQTRDLMKGLG